MNGLIEIRSQVIAYANDFLLMTYISLPALVIVWLMRRPDFSGQPAPKIEAVE